LQEPADDFSSVAPAEDFLIAALKLFRSLNFSSGRGIMEKKVVLITGAKGGLGSFVTKAFLAVSATVVGTSRSINQSDFKNDRFNAIPADIIQPARP
jgi:NADPH:quinone reductase-like Zn-dependent oxidoreductase